MGLIRPPLERRLNDFLNDVADHLAALEAEQRLTRERLAQDEQFLDVGSKGSTVQSCITWTEGLLPIEQAVGVKMCRFSVSLPA